MQKIQILFPDPLIRRMRDLAGQMDLPVSEIVRRATEKWLDQMPETPRRSLVPPAVDAGRSLLAASDMREAFYE